MSCCRRECCGSTRLPYEPLRLDDASAAAALDLLSLADDAVDFVLATRRPELRSLLAARAGPA